MPDVPFDNLVAVAAIAVGIPLALGLVPWLRVPAVVLEIVAGIVVGPSVLGLVRPDTAVRVISVLGLGFLLFLGGLEVEVDRLRGRLLRAALAGFGLSIGLGLAVGIGLGTIGLVGDPFLVAVILLATSLGVIVPILKDAGAPSSTLGQAVIAAGSVADFGAVVLLSLFFSRESGSAGARLLLLATIGLAAAVVALAVVRAERVERLSAVLLGAQDTTAQVRVRGAFLLLVAFVGLAQALGLEVILGAFLAGVVVAIVDRDERMTHPLFRQKLEAIGFGVFIPVFFVASGMTIDLGAILAGPTSLALVPLFLAGLLVVRGVPAIVFLPLLDRRRVLAAGLLQATSLPFIVAASQIGQDLGLLGAATAAGLVTAGLLSVLVFPASALALLRAGAPEAAREERGAEAPTEAGDRREAM